jgi:hypothetical protein
MPATGQATKSDGHIDITTKLNAYLSWFWSLEMIIWGIPPSLALEKDGDNFFSLIWYTINKNINELKTKIDNIKVEVTQDMENLRKKN